MIVAFDASLLVYVIDANANAPIDPETGAPVDRCGDRVEHLLATLQQQDARIIIPTPALAEVLVKAEAAGPDLLRTLKNTKHFRIASFDERAAVEFAARQAERARAGRRDTAATRAKVKFDDQIIAIAVVEGVEEIYSDDEDITQRAEGRFKVTKIRELPLPPQEAQASLPLDPEPDNEEGRD